MEAPERPSPTAPAAVADPERDGRTWTALGTTAVVLTAEPEGLERAHHAAAALVDEVDLACSRFRPDSELSRLPGRGATTVSPLLWRALVLALAAARATDGLVDPTGGASIAALGYDRDLPPWADDADAPGGAAGAPRGDASNGLAFPGWRAVALDERRRRVTVPAGVVVDLGATAKGLAADLAADRAARAAGCGVLVSLGGDIAVAGRPPVGGWPVLVTDDHRVDPDGPGQVVGLHRGGLATSSTTVRRWRQGGVVRHHLLDPRTGLPADTPWRTASVVAGTCAWANAASTAAVLLGDAAPAWLARRRMAARLVDGRGRVTTVGGWPTEDPEEAPCP